MFNTSGVNGVSIWGLATTAGGADGSISFEESKLPRDKFNWCDIDGDGQLRDKQELERYWECVMNGETA